MNGRYSRCSSKIPDYLIDKKKDNTSQEMPDNTKVNPNNISD